jgi:hypothetical protein
MSEYVYQFSGRQFQDASPNFGVKVITPAYYIDPLLGDDSNAGTSIDKPWATLGKIASAGAWVAGNNILLHCGRTFTERLVVGANGTADLPITITNYGLVSEGLPLMRPVLANSKAVDCGGYAGIIIDGLDCKSTDNDPAIWFSAYQSGANLLPITIRNCRVTSSDTGTGAGIQGYVGRGFNPTVIDAWTNPPGDVLIENNYIYSTGNCGIGLGDYRNFIVRGNTVVGCCVRSDQIGIIVSQTQNQSLMTWTVHSGNIYKTTITSSMRGELRGLSGCDCIRLNFPSGDVWSLRENISVPINSISSGDFQISSGVLYVNLGGINPNTANQSSISFAGVRDWVIEDNLVIDTVKIAFEGVGIQADAYSGYGVIRRNYVRTNNGQPGIASNDARSIEIYSNVVENTSSGAGGGSAYSDSYQGSGPITCENNLAIVNGLITDRAAFNFGGTKSGGSFKFNNNLVVGTNNAALQFYSPDSSSQVEWKNNCYFGSQNSRNIYNSTLTESSNLNIDPLVRSDFVPVADGVRFAGKPVSRLDYYGNIFWDTPTIGAVQYSADIQSKP